MNKLKSIKIQKPDGTFTSKIPIGADAKDVDLTDGRTVQQAITSLDQEIDENYEDLIQISNTQPVSEANKIWIKSNDTQIEIPTMDDLTAVEAKIGSPLVAATAAAMTDTTKVYVYTGSETGYTNGNWYYYNGSTWVSGGVYNAVAVSTDTTLTQQGQAADAKKTGDEISDLNSILSDVTEVETITMDKRTGTKVLSYITGSALIGPKQTCCLVYFACQPGITYTISKILSARFRVGYTATIPTNGARVSGFIENNTGTLINITPVTGAQYLVIYYYDGANDTLDESTIYDSLMITYQENITAIDKTVRRTVSKNKPLSDDAKIALLNCFQHVAWIDDQGQTYYDALESVLQIDQYPKITAVFNLGANVIYTDDTLDSLKQYLTVKYYETKESLGTVIPSANYSLSGTLVEGISIVFVSYSGLTTSFIINGVADYYNIWEWDFANASILHMNRFDFYAATSYEVATNIYRLAAGNADGYRTSFWTTKGKQGTYIVDNNNSGTVITPYQYPIPMPASATKATFTLSNSLYYGGMQVWTYNGNGNWTREAQTGWKQGSSSLILTSVSENRYITLNCKTNDDSSFNNSTYLPPSVVITFE